MSLLYHRQVFVSIQRKHQNPMSKPGFSLCTNVCEQRTIGAKNITGITVFLGILIIEAITFSYYRQKYNFSAASHRSKIQYNEKSWNNTPFRASFQHKKEVPDSKLHQVRYLFWILDIEMTQRGVIMKKTQLITGR